MTVNTHHTKLKGDIAVTAVIFDLTKKGFIISEPMSENAAYDLICDTGEKLLRIQVKYRANGQIPTSSSWADKNGSHRVTIDDTKIDYFALVNEDYTKICYPLSNMKGMTIRFEHPTVHFGAYQYYEDYLDFESEIKPSRQKFKNGDETIVGSILKTHFEEQINLNKNVKEISEHFKISRKTTEKYLLEYDLKTINQKTNDNMTEFLNLDKIVEDLKITRSVKITSKNLGVSVNTVYRFIKNENINLREITKYTPSVIPQQTKIQWPTIEEMAKLVFEKPTSQLAKELRVSDVAIGKFCKKHNIPKPKRGYWAKLESEKV